ncbi:sidestep protein-like protein [Leptotrombidium deliense]|uniref:Sidestep protein-like protein n=1 Tax=Leptotrombidium deliense TaxID=299467 RepID=A0A443SRV8_9ACAR|nr:sidestep protein-like protein [Leptotrombidium deliense]
MSFLTIANIKEEDAGEYRCRVDFRWARTINTVVILDIIDGIFDSVNFHW